MRQFLAWLVESFSPGSRPAPRSNGPSLPALEVLEDRLVPSLNSHFTDAIYANGHFMQFGIHSKSHNLVYRETNNPNSTTIGWNPVPVVDAFFSRIKAVDHLWKLEAVAGSSAEGGHATIGVFFSIDGQRNLAWNGQLFEATYDPDSGWSAPRALFKATFDFDVIAENGWGGGRSGFGEASIIACDLETGRVAITSLNITDAGQWGSAGRPV